MLRNSVGKDSLSTDCTEYRPPGINLCWLATSGRSPVWTNTMVPMVWYVPSGQESSGGSALTALETRSWQDDYSGSIFKKHANMQTTYCSDVRKHGKEVLSPLNKGAELNTQLFNNQISNPFKILIPWYLFSSCIGMRSQNLATVQFANIGMKHFNNINMF